MTLDDDPTLVELDWLLSQNLAWAQRVEQLAIARGVSTEEMAETFDCVKLLLQMRAAELS